MGLKTLQSVVM